MDELAHGRCVVTLGATWLRDNPLPQPEPDADKNTRGRVCIVGGSLRVPGGLLLTAEAAFRSGAGKVQLACPETIAVALGIALPEAAVFPVAQDKDGELDCLPDCAHAGMSRSDAVVVGPAMGSAEAAERILGQVLEAEHDAALIVDAAALMNLASHADAMARRRRTILTPHLGEMAALLDCDAGTIEADRISAVRTAAHRYQAVVALKGATSLIADQDGALFAYEGGGVGLATGGSGDVLCGIMAGLAARGASSLDAALWGVWLHGEAGRKCAADIGSLGFLARELPPCVPALMDAA